MKKIPVLLLIVFFFSHQSVKSSPKVESKFNAAFDMIKSNDVAGFSLFAYNTHAHTLVQ